MLAELSQIPRRKRIIVQIHDVGEGHAGGNHLLATSKTRKGKSVYLLT